MAAMRLSRQSALVAAVSLAAGVLLTGCGGSPGPPPSAVSSSAAGTGSPSAKSAPPAASVTPRATASASPSARPVAPGAGALPQTRAFPSTRTPAFDNAMADLWLAVTTGYPRFARPGFFPLAAYKQVKAIPYPVPDWQDRLWSDFVLDVRAAHRLVGSGAHLDRVVVPEQYAAWVYPGACHNKIGYWHVRGARVVYRAHGQERSFGIASLISWRGVWYVVHLGAVQRTVVTGIVYQPAAGPGVPGPPGGC
ncbi:MAG TPA: hypothetical protein VE888_02530 [Streptosporangiaceae bacterium]|nr:hypothetical protein [Streptosporangiaceae bacterium]